MDVSDIAGAKPKRLHVSKRFGGIANNILSDNSRMIAAGVNHQPVSSDIFQRGTSEYERMPNRNDRSIDARDINGPKKN